MSRTLLELAVDDEAAVALTRRRAREIVAALGLDDYRQVRVATAVSEIVRNALSHAGGGRVSFILTDGIPSRLAVRVVDRGGLAGASALRVALRDAPPHADAQRATHGLGIAQRLADRFACDLEGGHGATVTVSFDLDGARSDPGTVAALRSALPEAVRVDEAQELRDSNALLHASLVQAEAAVAGREELLAIVSHDLRSPLGAIVTSAEALEYAEIDGAAREFVDDMQRLILTSARRMDRLIADLLDLAGLDTGTLTVELDTHDAQEILGASVRAAQAAATENGLTLVHQPTPGPHVLCDRERVLQLLSNLIGNAIKFSPPGAQIGLDVRRHADQARFSVQDAGRGMDSEELAHLFERHWQRDHGDRRGIGLGMSIVKALVDAHGGRIDVDSQPNVGTVVRIDLPLAGPHAAR